MQLLSFLGIMAVIGSVAVFLMYFLSASAMDSRDSSKIDEIPENHLK